jgi:hypothetical protein
MSYPWTLASSSTLSEPQTWLLVLLESCNVIDSTAIYTNKGNYLQCKINTVSENTLPRTVAKERTLIISFI